MARCTMQGLPFYKMRDYYANNQGFQELPDGNLLHLKTMPNFLSPSRAAHVIKTDTAGNILWRTIIGENKPYNRYNGVDMTLLQDNGVAVYWNEDIPIWSEDTVEFVDYLLKLDANGNEVWRHYFVQHFDRQIDHIFTAKNGDIIGCGYFFYFEKEGEPDSSLWASWVFRMDVNGNLKWQRDIWDSRFPDLQFLYAGAEMENGDLVFTGTIKTHNPMEGGNVWLLKLDSMGCLTPGCGDFQEIVPVDEPSRAPDDISIRPNPASSYVQIQINAAAKKDCRVMLYDFTGRLVLSEPIIEGANTHSVPLTSCPNGWYFVCITENGRVVARKKLAVVR